jgi:predicted RNase H-like HicB family nuclease
METMMEFLVNSSGVNSRFCFLFYPNFGDILVENIYKGGTMTFQLTKVFKKVSEGYIGFVEELPGANTQAETLDEARVNLEEAIELVLEANRSLTEELLQDQDVIREPIFLSVA